MEEWRNRPLESFYPVVFFDALRVNIRDEGQVSKKAVYLALAIRLDGQKEILGMWIEKNEGAKFWLGIMNELKTRGVKEFPYDIFALYTVFGMGSHRALSDCLATHECYQYIKTYHVK